MSACAVIPASTQCTLKIKIPQGTLAGSFKITINNDNLSNPDLSRTSQTIGIQQAAYNNLSGANGITLNLYKTVISGTNHIIVTGLVASATAGIFNNIVLVDSNGNSLPNQQILSGNLGAGATPLTQGNTFSIMIPAPTMGASQTIKVQTQNITANDAQMKSVLKATTIVDTATTSTTLTVVAAGVGIANMLPSAIYLNADNPSQQITFSNTGDDLLTLSELVSSNPNIEIIGFNPNTPLASGSSITITLKMKDLTAPGVSGNLALVYNNGKENIPEEIVSDQNINPAPITPTPSPEPTPTPQAGLTVSISPDSDFFTTTAIGSVTRQLILTNTGNTVENAIKLTLPANFTISNENNNTCTISQATNPATISNNLVAGGGNCNITLIYTNNVTTPQTNANISVSYNYNNGVSVPTPSVAAINYRVTQSTANLSLTPNTTQNYGAIVSNNLSVSAPISYILSNNGDETATNLAFNFSGINQSLFETITGGTCISGGNLTNTTGNNICTINTQFGPAPNGSAGNKTALFNVSYFPYASASVAITNNVSLSGVVTAAPPASFVVSYNSTDFNGGTGTHDSPYWGYANSKAYEIDAIYTNNSDIVVSGFTTENNLILPAEFIRTAHQCNGVSLAANGGNCTDRYTLSISADVGIHNLNLQNIPVNWIDSSGTYVDETITAPIIYTNLITPVITTVNTVTPSENATLIGVGTPVTITFSSPVNPSTVNANSFKLGTTPGGGQISASSIVVNEDHTSATFKYTPDTALAVNTTYYIDVEASVIDEQGNPISPLHSSFSTQMESYTIFASGLRPFVDPTGYPGSYSGADINGISGADAICQADPQCASIGQGTICKAMLAGENRRAAPNPLNWVLAPYSAYKNIDSNTPIGITGITPAGYTQPATNSQVFAFTLGSSNYSPYIPPIWTGYNPDWTTGESCSSWTSNSESAMAVRIHLAYTLIWTYVSNACSNKNAIFCVQQP